MLESPLEKVTAFITRDATAGREILVFEHPPGMIQVPAGTVKEREPVSDAALREAWEETGLTALNLVAYLGQQPQPMPPDLRAVLRRVSVLQNPAPDAPQAVPSFVYHGLRRGLYVRQTGSAENGYVPVAYEEYDGPAHLANAPSRSLTGWIEADSVSSLVIRHFFHLSPMGATPERWVQSAEEWGLPFDLFWLPISGKESALTRLGPWQAAWLADFKDRLL